MGAKTSNLGQIAAIWISAVAPENQKLIWYNTLERIHKVYETATGEWVALNPQIVTESTISDLSTIASHSGLSLGKFFYLTDIGTLAVAITTTKIWYVDSFNNYVVNDLRATITAYINSDNLLIDGSTGVWNNNTGRLEFSFSEVATGANLQTDNDHIVIRRKNGTAWSWIKAKLSGFISAVSGNSISWNNGFYFNFTTAVNNIKNRVGGIVGFELFKDKIGSEYFEEGGNATSVYTDIKNVAVNNQQVLSQAKSYTDTEVGANKIYGKQYDGNWNLLENPPQTPNISSELRDILLILVSWVNVLQISNRIKIGVGFSANGKTGDVNYSDTVRSAIEKLIYKIKNQSLANGINVPNNFDVSGIDGDFQKSDDLSVLLQKIIYKVLSQRLANNIFLPNDWSEVEYSGGLSDEDDLATAIGKLAKMCYDQAISDNVKLPNDFNVSDYSKETPIANESVTAALGKLSAIVYDLINTIWGAKFKDDDWYATVSLGDKIGEFDSDGNPLYSASLEGAIYLLSLWYSSHFSKLSVGWTSIDAYYKYGRFDGRQELSQTCQYRVFENTLVLKCLSSVSINTYMGNEGNNILFDNNRDDVTLTFKNLPQWIINNLLKKYGGNNPFTLGVSVVGYVQISGFCQFIAHGMMYGIMVQAPQGSNVDSYLKLIPYWTDADKFESINIPTPTNEYNWINVLENRFVNESGLFGTDWIASKERNYETWVGKITPFIVEIPLY